MNRHPQEVCSDIRAKVKEALTDIHKPDFTDREMLLEMNFRQHQKARAAAFYPGAQLSDCNTVTYRAKNVQDLMTSKMFMFEI